MSKFTGFVWKRRGLGSKKTKKKKKKKERKKERNGFRNNSICLDGRVSDSLV